MVTWKGEGGRPTAAILPGVSTGMPEQPKNQRGSRPSSNRRFGDRTTPPRRRPAPAPRRRQTFVQRNRGPILGAIGVAVIVALLIILALKVIPGTASKSTSQAGTNQPVSASVLSALTTVPQSRLDAVGAGSASNTPKAAPAPALKSDGKPEILYVGGEFCPFCAAERWALVTALSRFGTFSNLRTARSSGSDVFPNTPTFTFYGSSYTSKYLAFTPVEEFSDTPNGSGYYTTLQKLTSSQQQIVANWDKTPYVSSSGAIPFIDFGGKYVVAGATYNPGVLNGLDWSQVAAKIGDSTSVQAKGILGSANLLTAAICKATGGKPSNVCQAKGTQTAAALLRGQ